MLSLEPRSAVAIKRRAVAHQSETRARDEY